MIYLSRKCASTIQVSVSDVLYLALALTYTHTQTHALTLTRTHVRIHIDNKPLDNKKNIHTFSFDLPNIPIQSNLAAISPTQKQNWWRTFYVMQINKANSHHNNIALDFIHGLFLHRLEYNTKTTTTQLHRKYLIFIK